MAEKKGKLDLKGLKNLFGTKRSSINMEEGNNANEDPNYDTENSHLDEVEINILNFLNFIEIQWKTSKRGR